MPLARFWQFAHLSDATKNMGWVDLIPRAGNLYIGGLQALYQQPDLFKQAHITHILSVIDYDIYELGQFPKEKYTHLMIREDDEPNVNLLQHFRRMCEFIDGGLKGEGGGGGGGAVFVHCAMGKSRSATACCAYLMWKFGVDATQALEQVCEGRPVCSPNPGFMEQLGIWRRMLKAEGGEAGAEAEGVYREWERERFTGDWWTWDKRRRGEVKL
ncbi:hypothetical protein B0A50_07128 [Salinomyces thailandicus]|uniref:Uncharacterized protein n=1 Tax=Salinomyces thailandicus TaxID=706561 RepID=A0A4U0TNI8_9PEZI|nr:hypothetical protein B0A50_07128 [Salinomyces thailandica]